MIFESIKTIHKNIKKMSNPKSPNVIEGINDESEERKVNNIFKLGI